MIEIITNQILTCIYENMNYYVYYKFLTFIPLDLCKKKRVGYRFLSLIYTHVYYIIIIYIQSVESRVYVEAHGYSVTVQYDNEFKH